ncbi:hypothetical protein GQ457_04G007140 [Hibiscus cannabinus]
MDVRQSGGFGMSWVVVYLVSRVILVGPLCFLAELWAVCDGLRYAWEASFRQIVLETDNKEVASICNDLSSTFNRSALVLMIHDLLR